MTNHAPPQDAAKMLQLLHTHQGLNPLPLLELLVEQTPDRLGAFCNQAIFALSELLRDEQPTGVLPGHVMQQVQQLHTLREAFRQVRGAPSWP